MDCLITDKADDDSHQPNQAEMINLLKNVFANYHSKSDIFLPPEVFYQNFTGPQDAERMASSIFKWLGVKHHSLLIHMDRAQEEFVKYKLENSGNQLILGRQATEDPFLCAAAVAHGIIHHLLHRAKIRFNEASDNEALADLGTIYAGLGLVILNGLSVTEGVLGSMAKPNYTAECLDYFDERRIVRGLWQPYVLPSVAI